MNTLQFLQRILPSTGLYCAVTFDDNHPAPRHAFYSTVEDLEKAVLSFDSRGYNTYYGLAAYTEKSRKQTNVRAIKVVAMDIDCGADKPYPSWKEGLVALGSFVAKFSLPKPVVVYSGNGLHVYWVLNLECSTDEWKPVADAIKSLALDNGFAIDPAITADSARILRPVGTHNPKTGNEVKVLVDAPNVTLEDLRIPLSKHVAMLKMGITSPQAQGMSQPQRGALLADLEVKQDYLPSDPVRIATGCQHIKWAIENQDKIKEPKWYLLMGVAAYCENPEQVAIDWSSAHPEFDEASTVSKLHQWKNKITAPTKCETFAAQDPDKCKGCKFKGKITSPAQLGRTYAEVPSKAAIVSPETADIPLPEHYQRTAFGIKVVVDGAPLSVCPFDVYPVGYGKDESLGYEVVRYMWDRPHAGWSELSLRQAHLVEGSKDFASVIADQGIVLSNKFETGNFQMLLRSYMDELKKKRGLSNLYNSMGWKDNFNEFVVGSTIIQRQADGTVIERDVSLSASISRTGDDLYARKGSLEEWTKFTKLLDTANLVPHKFMLAIGFASILLKFTGIKGVLYSFYGHTGGGKTLGLYLQQSVWGNPDALLFGNKFTQNSFFSRLATHGNLPMTIDELTNTNSEQIGDMIYWITQGKDKSRLSRTAEERAPRDWAALVSITTNKSWAEAVHGNGLVSDAQYARLLEFNVAVNPIFAESSAIGRQLHTFLMQNYGHAGVAFAKKLMELGPEAVQAMVVTAYETFAKKYGVSFAGQDRFWEAGIVLPDIAAQLAQEFGLTLHDYESGTRWAVNQIIGVKDNAIANKQDAFDIINTYIAEHMGSTITVLHTAGLSPVRADNRPYINEILVRYDMYRNDAMPTTKFNAGTVLVERANFRKWLSSRGYDYKSIMAELSVEGAIATPASDKAYFGKGIGIKVPQCYVVGFNLSHPRLAGVFDDADQMVTDQTLGQLKAVS